MSTGSAELSARSSISGQTTPPTQHMNEDTRTHIPSSARPALKVRTRESRTASSRPTSEHGPGTPNGHGQHYWAPAWSPYGANPDLGRSGSQSSCPASPVPVGMAPPGSYVVFLPGVPGSPRHAGGYPQSPLMGSPCGTPTAMHFPPTPFAQHGGAPGYHPFNGAPGPYPGPHVEPPSPSRGPHHPAQYVQGGFFHPLFNGFSPLVVAGAPMHPGPPGGLASPGKQQRTSGGGGDKFRAYHPSPLKPPGTTGPNGPMSRRSFSCTGHNPYAATPPQVASPAASPAGGGPGAHQQQQLRMHQSVGGLQYPQASRAPRPPTIPASPSDDGCIRESSSDVLPTLPQASRGGSASSAASGSLAASHHQHQQQTCGSSSAAAAQQVAPSILASASSPPASPRPMPPAAASAAAGASSAAAVAAVNAAVTAMALPSVAEAIASAVASARASMSGNTHFAATMRSARPSISGVNVGDANDIVAAAAAALQHVGVGEPSSIGDDDDDGGHMPSAASSAAAAMAAVAAAMESQAAVQHAAAGGHGAMYASMMPAPMHNMQSAAAAAAAMYPMPATHAPMGDLSGLTAQYWPHLQAAGMGMAVPLMSAYPMGHVAQPGHMHAGLMHAAMMQQLSAAAQMAGMQGMQMQAMQMAGMQAMQHPMAAAAYPGLDASQDPYLAAAEQLAQLQALQQGGHHHAQAVYGVRGQQAAMAMGGHHHAPHGVMAGASPGGMPGPMGTAALLAAQHRQQAAAAAAIGIVVPGGAAGAHRHHRRNAGEVRVGADGQARLNARQRRTLRRAKERAIRGLLEAGQQMVARAGEDVDDLDDSNSCDGSDSDGEHDDLHLHLHGCGSELDGGVNEAAFGTPDAAPHARLVRQQSVDVMPGSSGSESSGSGASSARGSGAVRAQQLSAQALAAAAAAGAAAGHGTRMSVSGASSVCDAVHSQTSGGSSVHAASSNASPAGAGARQAAGSEAASPAVAASASDVPAASADASELHATLLRNLDSLKEKMGPMQQKLAAAAAAPASAATPAAAGGIADADLSALIQQLHSKREDGVVDDKLLRDLTIIQNLIGALKTETRAGAPAQPPRGGGHAHGHGHKGGAGAAASGPMPIASAGPREIYLTNKPAKGFALVH